MKITSGIFKKKNITFVAKLPFRPTKVRVRQAIFNILKHRFFNDFSELFVLDCYAGTGSFGFEALSLGARHVTFIEKNYEIASMIKKSAYDLNVLDRINIHNKDFVNFINNDHSLFDIVFLDPPYFKDLVCPSVAHLVKIGAIHEKSILCVECSKKDIMTINQSLSKIPSHREDPNTQSAEGDTERRNAAGSTSVSIQAPDRSADNLSALGYMNANIILQRQYGDVVVCFFELSL
jgi:16S rRNA (guanine966-N2)-methyltransferase